MQRLFSADQRELLYVKASGLCAICKIQLDSNFHADHIIPWSAGGETTISNGQALCPGCNLSKGGKMKIKAENYKDIASREWQQEGMEEVFADIADGENNHLFVGCPGSGKTRLAIAITKALFDAGVIDYVITLAPKDIIRQNWAAEFRSLTPLNVVPVSSGKMRQQHINSLLQYKGIATTYQSNVKGYGALKNICDVRKVLVILDESHWARTEQGKGRQAFGAALLDAFGGATQVLSLSGTPWRSDRSQIPFVRYKDGVVQPTKSYSYTKAITDNVCRPIVFHRVDGLIEFDDPGYGLMRGYLSSETEAKRTDDNEYFCIQPHIGKKYMRAATDPDINMCIRIIEKAHRKLTNVRKSHSNAGGLIICRGIPEADAIAEQMEDNLGIIPVIVHSDNVASTAEIEAFARSEATWILSVGMVTEGTDIPRLRVAVHLHTTMSLLHFRQFCGRVVRWENYLDENQVSHIFIPQYGPLHLMAQDVEKEVELSLFDGDNNKRVCKKCNVSPCICVCHECGKKPCVCPCSVCGQYPCECDDDGFFRAISSDEEESVGSTSRGDDYTTEEQQTADEFSSNEKLRGRYSEVQLLAFSRLCQDRDMMRTFMGDLTDAEFDELWSKIHEKKNGH